MVRSNRSKRNQINNESFDLKTINFHTADDFQYDCDSLSETSSRKAQIAHTKKILIVLSAADTWIRKDGTKYPTGYWAEEFVVIHEKFVAAGYTVDEASPGGKKPTADPHSIDPKVVGERAPVFKKYLQIEFGTATNATWLLASRLRKSGADYKRGNKNWAEFIVRDKNMISGQNLASSARRSRSGGY
jgi:hypothetical protein